MGKPKVLILKKTPQVVIAYMEDHCDIIDRSSDENLSLAELKHLLVDVDGLLLSGLTIDRELLESAPRLKIVSNVGQGSALI